MKVKKFLSIALASVLSVAMLTGCSSSNDSSGSGSSDKGSVYYLSFKPEQEKQWKEIAKKYKEETDRKSTRLNSSHNNQSRMPSSA